MTGDGAARVIALPRPGLRLRPTTDGDLPLLRRLYGDLRADELAAMPWPTEQKEAFLDSQFALQHRHFVTHRPRADFWLIERGREIVGRLYLDRSGPTWRILDVGLFASARGGGLGRGLINWVQAEAARRDAQGVDLHVAVINPRARALYARLGFVAIDAADGLHQRMVWPTPDRQLKTA